MAANDDEQNDLDAAEGLADLNRIALQDLPINREDEEMEGIAVNGPYDESDLLSTQYSSRKEAYQALLLDSFHRKKRKGIYQLVPGKNVCRVEFMGDRDRVIWNSKQKRFVNDGHVVMSLVPRTYSTGKQEGRRSSLHNQWKF